MRAKFAPFGFLMVSIGLSWIWSGVKTISLQCGPLIISRSWLPANELHYYQMTLMNTDARFVASSLTVPRCTYIMSDHTGSVVIRGAQISNLQRQSKYSRKGCECNRFISSVMTHAGFSRTLIFRHLIKRYLSSGSFPDSCERAPLPPCSRAHFVQGAFEISTRTRPHSQSSRWL